MILRALCCFDTPKKPALICWRTPFFPIALHGPLAPERFPSYPSAQ